jgi:hypothetical protein
VGNRRHPGRIARALPRTYREPALLPHPIRRPSADTFPAARRRRNSRIAQRACRTQSVNSAHMRKR